MEQSKINGLTSKQYHSIKDKVIECVSELNKSGYEEGLLISMPNYFIDMLKDGFKEMTGVELPDAVCSFAGCKIVPAYENKITVYHPFMIPQNSELVKHVEINNNL